MNNSVKIILGIVFLFGLIAVIGLRMVDKPLQIEVRDLNQRLLVDSNDIVVVSQGEAYDIKTNVKHFSEGEQVKWYVESEDEWVKARELNEFQFKKEGLLAVKLFVDEKERGIQMFKVLPKRGALIGIPSKLIAGNTYELKDLTAGSISRTWYKKNSHDDNDLKSFGADQIQEFKFDYPGKYDLVLEVNTAEGLLTKEIKVEVRELPKVKKTQNKTENDDARTNEVRPYSGTTTRVEPKDEDDRLVVSKVPVTPTSSGAGYFQNHYSRDESFSALSSEFVVAKEECFTYNKEKRTITLDGLQKDVCLSAIYLAPNREIDDRKVKILISNTRDAASKEVITISKTVGMATRDRPMAKVNIQRDVCKLKKGESYSISIVPLGKCEVADVDSNNSSCFLGWDDSVGELIIPGKTKILGLEMKTK